MKEPKIEIYLGFSLQQKNVTLSNQEFGLEFPSTKCWDVIVNGKVVATSLTKREAEKLGRANADSYIPPSNCFSHYHFEIDYESESDCEGYGCNSEGICRCRRIYGLNVTEIPWDYIYNSFVKGQGREPFSTPMQLYAVDRILRIHKVYELDSWTATSSGGYYGDELDDVELNDYKKVAEQISSLQYLNDTDIVLKLLELEYGFILDTLKGRTFTIEEVPYESLSFGQNEYRRKVTNAENVYENHCKTNLPQGVVIPDGTRYRVIDGYHRLTAASHCPTVSVIVGNVP